MKASSLLCNLLKLILQIPRSPFWIYKKILSISNGIVSFKLYDKHDDFDFNIHVARGDHFLYKRVRGCAGIIGILFSSAII